MKNHGKQNLMNVYDKLLAASPFIKSPRNDENYEQFTDIENYAIDSLIAFFEDLIRYSKELGIMPLQVSKLAKALHLLYHFGQIDIDGNMRISSTNENNLPNHLTSLVCSIYGDDISLTLEGYEKNDFGGDSFSKNFFCLCDKGNDYGLYESINEWRQMFIDNLQTKPGLEVDDYVEIDEV